MGISYIIDDSESPKGQHLTIDNCSNQSIADMFKNAPSDINILSLRMKFKQAFQFMVSHTLVDIAKGAAEKWPDFHPTFVKVQLSLTLTHGGVFKLLETDEFVILFHSDPSLVTRGD